MRDVGPDVFTPRREHPHVGLLPRRRPPPFRVPSNRRGTDTMRGAGLGGVGPHVRVCFQGVLPMS